MNFYAVLGISRDADEETIRTAYRMLARRYHPDRGAGSCPEKFRQVREAYETLIDGGSRQAYDLSLRGANGPVLVRSEFVVQQSGHSRQEDPGTFGRFERVPQGGAYWPNHGFRRESELYNLFVWEWL